MAENTICLSTVQQGIVTEYEACILDMLHAYMILINRNGILQRWRRYLDMAILVHREVKLFLDLLWQSANVLIIIYLLLDIRGIK